MGSRKRKWILVIFASLGCLKSRILVAQKPRPLSEEKKKS